GRRVTGAGPGRGDPRELRGRRALLRAVRLLRDTGLLRDHAPVRAVAGALRAGGDRARLRTQPPGPGPPLGRRRPVVRDHGGALGMPQAPTSHFVDLTTSMRTLVIIPAYNEEDALPGVLKELRAVHPGLDVLVVSDGSRDATASVARKAGVTVLELPY